ncbi:MAG: hypothetical protein J5934_01265 [Succinivibrio sp.]|nr:hypothetical protein [Succinivibrio sp.]
MKRLALAFPLLLTFSAHAALSGIEAGGLAIQGLTEDPTLRGLYSEGLVVPNQPLPMKDSERRIARDYVQQFIDQHKAQEGDFKRQERRVINALLFNYGLQLLDDGRVVILDVYLPVETDAQGNPVPALMPGMPLAKENTLTRENAQKLYTEAVEERKKLEAELARKQRQSMQTTTTSGQNTGIPAQSTAAPNSSGSLIDGYNREFYGSDYHSGTGY